MKKITTGLVAGLIGFCSYAWSFTPANGLWRIDAEQNGLPGRGLRINVENEIVVLTYYGYRKDGTSLFLLSAGKMAGNTFSGTLQEYKDGVSLGESTYHSATAATSPGTVTVTFSSGTHGTITLPGEPAKAISNIPFGYNRTPDGLMGTYLLVYGSTSLVPALKTLTTNTGKATDYGNGVVVNAANNFGCENGVGAYSEWILCSDTNGVAEDDVYYFKMSGDRGTGVGTWKGAGSNYFPLDVLRTNTASGRATGINDGTMQSLQTYSAPISNSGSGARPDVDSQASSIKSQPVPMSGHIQLSEDQKTAFGAWRESLQATIQSAQ